MVSQSTTAAMPVCDKANAWQTHAKKLAEHAVRHLLNRNDGMGAYGSSGPYMHALNQEISEARTEEIQRRLVSHFAGRTIGGIYSNSAPEAGGKWYARFGCIDIDLKDDHPYKEARRKRNHLFAMLLLRRLDAAGIPCAVEDSNGRGAYHIWFRLSDRIEVARLYSFLQSLVADAEQHGFEPQFQRVDADGNGLVLPNGQPNYGSDLPETFPKQDTTTGKGFGNFIRLPGKHHTYEHLSRIWGDGEWLSIEESVDAWLSLPAADVALIPDLPADEPEVDSVAPAKATVAAVYSNTQDKIGTLAERTIETESWMSILQGAGWKLHSENGAESKWTRPGKDGGVSATLNFNGNNLLTVFTTAVSGLNQNGATKETFSKWRFYCWSYGFENRQVEAAKAYLPVDVVAEHDRKSREAWASQQNDTSGEKKSGAGIQAPAKTVIVRSFAGIDASELASYATQEPDWLVQDVFTIDEPLLVGARSKGCKTLQLTDLAVAVASGTAWMNIFEVPKRRKVLFISGETNRRRIAKHIEKACVARELVFNDLAGFLRIEAVDFPCLPRLADQDGIRQDIETHGIELVIVDPLYRGLSGIDSSRLSEMGDAIKSFQAACAPACMVLSHHVVKSAAREYGTAPQLEDMTGAGIAESCGQWWLVGRNEKYQWDWKHDLCVQFGGREGQGGGRRILFNEHDWTFQVDAWHEYTEQAQADEHQRQADARREARDFKRETARGKILAACRNIKTPQSKSQIEARADAIQQFFRAAFADLLKDETLVERPYKDARGRQQAVGYLLREYASEFDQGGDPR